jgi:hypothetical protein
MSHQFKHPVEARLKLAGALRNNVPHAAARASCAMCIECGTRRSRNHKASHVWRAVEAYGGTAQPPPAAVCFTAGYEASRTVGVGADACSVPIYVPQYGAPIAASAAIAPPDHLAAGPRPPEYTASGMRLGFRPFGELWETAYTAAARNPAIGRALIGDAHVCVGCCYSRGRLFSAQRQGRPDEALDEPGGSQASQAMGGSPSTPVGAGIGPGDPGDPDFSSPSLTTAHYTRLAAKNTRESVSRLKLQLRQSHADVEAKVAQLDAATATAAAQADTISDLAQKLDKSQNGMARLESRMVMVRGRAFSPSL